MNKYKIRLIITGISVVALISLAVFTKVKIAQFQKDRAEDSLSQYTQKLGLVSVKSICNKDSDGDGYSSCSYNNGKKVIPLECDASLFWNTHSCKKPKQIFN